MAKSKKLHITSHMDWTEDLIKKAYIEIEKIANEDMELKGMLYPNQIEIVSAEQMLDAYSSIGMPIHPYHWSYGKEFIKNKKRYDAGQQGLALEMILNTNPAVNLLMEDNDMVQQTMVMAHAAVGHNAVFANNINFKDWTNAGSIIDYMVFAREYIKQCEERYGEREVEQVIDACNALSPHGVDKFPRKGTSRVNEEMHLQKLLQREEERRINVDLVLDKTRLETKDTDVIEEDNEQTVLDEENLLYFIMKKSPSLPQWKREIIRIFWKINTYFYPQSLCKIVHEGFASFSHHYIMTRLEEKGIISPDAYMSFLQNHAGVVFQPTYDKKYYSGWNPYALGFAIFQDLKRMCEEPTEEDKEWFPNIVGRKWQDVVKEAAFEHKDETFILQYLSPKVMRDFKMFSIVIETAGNTKFALVTDIHDDVGYAEIRRRLAERSERISFIPQIVIEGANLSGDRELMLSYRPWKGCTLNEATIRPVLQYIHELWGYNVKLTQQKQ